MTLIIFQQSNTSESFPLAQSPPSKMTVEFTRPRHLYNCPDCHPLEKMEKNWIFRGQGIGEGCVTFGEYSVPSPVVWLRQNAVASKTSSSGVIE